MTHAYRETYLRTAMGNIGEMFDYAINEFGIPSEDFVQMFLSSEISRRLEAGDPKYLIGMSGAETALQVIEQTTGLIPEPEADERYDRTADHWCGWAIAYYQWLKAMPYRKIFAICSYDEIFAMYKTLHEADVSKFADTMERIRVLRAGETNLKRIRTAYGCSQSELARLSNVSLRSIQMYEQRNKDINKAQLATVAGLACALGCSMGDLLEAY